MEKPPGAVREGWRVDEDRETESGAPICAGLEAALKTMRCREVADVTVAAASGYDGDLAGDLAGVVELYELEEDPDEELLRRRGCFNDNEQREHRAARVDGVRDLGNAHAKRRATESRRLYRVRRPRGRDAAASTPPRRRRDAALTPP